MHTDLYSKGQYKKKNHSYHVEDSEFKWKIFKNILIKSNFIFNDIESVVEVGCGAGQVLANAKSSKIFNPTCKFAGYDINPDAIDLAKKIDKDLNFFNSDYLEIKNGRDDLILSADVFEHVENTYDFLSKLRAKGNFFLFNIPLEISFLSMIRKKNIFEDSYQKVGHLHFYNKRTALLTLKNCGYKIINEFMKDRLFELKKKNLKQLLILFPVIFKSCLTCPRLFGGYSLVVLAKNILIN